MTQPQSGTVLVTRTCTNCGNEFQAPNTGGRPLSFCSDTCRTEARTKPTRICIQCSKTFKRRESRWPNHCGDACHYAAQNACRNPDCTNVVRSGLYCSAACMRDALGTRTCLVCGNPVPVPTRPPFTRMPRFCSPQHRAIRANEHGFVPKDSTKFKQALAVGDLLPMLPNSQPYTQVDHLEVPAFDSLNPFAQRSIKWWNKFLTTVLPKAHLQPGPLEMYIAYVGTKGFGGGDDRPLDGCQRLARCWLWLSPEALATFNPYTVTGLWFQYHQAINATPGQIDQRRERILAKISSHKFLELCKRNPHQRQEMLRRIDAVNRDAQPPELTAWMPARYTPHLNKFFDLEYEHNEMYRKAHRATLAAAQKTMRHRRSSTIWEHTTQQFRLES